MYLYICTLTCPGMAAYICNPDVTDEKAEIGRSAEFTKLAGLAKLVSVGFSERAFPKTTVESP